VAERKGRMTVGEAGRKGGEATSERFSHDHFEEIGRKGGETVSQKYGHDHFEEIGRKGGRKVAELVARGKQSQ
jgi:uncharacterized protein